MIESVIEFFKNAIKDQIVGDPVWATIALIGQCVFAGRFIVQWISSELKKRSHVPNSFWFLSLLGSFILLSYSVHIKNPIFMLAFSLNTVIYLRNIHLIYWPAQGALPSK
jgi:lipid-A-disaccharide synthase-like uncharacterized protein